MVWTIKVAPDAREDLKRIYRHLVRTHHETFGHDLVAADKRASQRIAKIMRGLDRIAKVGEIGTRVPVDDLEFRHVSVDGTVYWFRLDEHIQTILIEGIFHGGQDHLGRMMVRLTDEGDG